MERKLAEWFMPKPKLCTFMRFYIERFNYNRFDL
jgi:hypothetical protein